LKKLFIAYAKKKAIEWIKGKKLTRLGTC